MCMYAKVVVVLYCLQIPRYFVVEDRIWDAATTVIGYDYGTDILFFFLTFDEHSTQVHILFVGGMNLNSLSLSLSATVGFHVPSLAKS